MDRSIRLLIVTLCVGWIAIGCSNADTKPVATAKDSSVLLADTAATSPNTILGHLSHSAEFSIFADLLAASGLTETLSQPGPFTVFAPNNSAFEKLGTQTIEKWKSDKRNELFNFLANHIVAGSIDPGDLKRIRVLSPLSGEDISVRRGTKVIFLNSKRISGQPAACTNGLIYSVPEPLIPAH